MSISLFSDHRVSDTVCLLQTFKILFFLEIIEIRPLKIGYDWHPLRFLFYSLISTFSRLFIYILTKSPAVFGFVKASSFVCEARELACGGGGNILLAIRDILQPKIQLYISYIFQIEHHLKAAPFVAYLATQINFTQAAHIIFRHVQRQSVAIVT